MNEKEPITKNKVIIENGEVKVVLNEETMKLGYYSIEEAKRINRERIKKIRELERMKLNEGKDNR